MNLKKVEQLATFKLRRYHMPKPVVDHLLDNYNHLVLNLLHPKWYNFYKFLQEKHNCQNFTLSIDSWVIRISQLLLSSRRRICFALTLPGLSERERHYLLQTIKALQDKNIYLKVYFDIDGTTTKIFAKSGKLNDVKQMNFDKNFHFLLVDDALLFEEPINPTLYEPQNYYFINKIDNESLQFILNNNWLGLDGESRSELLNH